MKKIILASSSPRRKNLLEQIGVNFTIIPSLAEEKITKSSPCEVVQELSQLKAEDVGEKIDFDSIIIGSDTIVALGDKILGKPKDFDDAFKMLKSLQGHTHTVYTGVCIIVKENTETKKYVFYDSTDVTMYSMTDEQIKAYIETGEPMDKAGSYGIQGKSAVFVKHINGDYNTVVGLPIAKIYNFLLDKNIDLLNL